MIEINKIKKCYGERTVLDVSSIKLKKGEVTVIVGPNGSGKSTLLKILSGIIKADDNNFTVNGKVLYLPQQCVAFNKTVEKNVLFSIDEKENQKEKCREILFEMKLLPLKDKNAKTLSGGEAQRLAIARLLIKKADFLILDEPSSAADIESSELIEKAILSYKEKTGCGVIMTTHSPAQAKKLGERIIMLCEGKVIEDGSAEEILQNPKSEWAEKFISQWRL